MSDEDAILADIGRKCAEDVSAAIRRNFTLLPDRRSAVVIASYAAFAAIGAAAGAFAAMTDGDENLNSQTLDALWADFLRPMMLGDFITKEPSA